MQSQPSIFGKHKLDTEEQSAKEAGLLIVAILFCGLIVSPMFLLARSANDRIESCKNLDGHVQVVRATSGKYRSVEVCIKDGKILEGWK